MTIEQVHKDFTERLESIYETREAASITDWVFESITGIKRLNRVTNRLIQPDNSTIQQLRDKLEELLRYKPVQYVLGEAWFYKMKFL